MLKREAELERYTSLDRELEKRARDGVFRPALGSARDPHLEAALRTRLEVLSRLGLVSQIRRATWTLHPELRAELDRMGRRADAMRAIQSVLPVSAARCRIVDKAEPPHAEREELVRGVQGVLRWKGLDEAGQFCAVIETTGGAVYHLPVSSRFASDRRVGQVLDLKRAVDKDRKIEEVASQKGWAYDLGFLPEGARGAYRARLEQLERMGLAAPDPDGQNRWRVQPDFRERVAQFDEGKPQPYWQRLSLRAQAQSLDEQKTYAGAVWLDAVRTDALGSTRFGREVQEALRVRHEYLRGLGLEPEGQKLRAQLVELQRQRLEQELVASGGPGSVSAHDRQRVTVAVAPSEGFEGRAYVDAAPNGQQFLVVRAPGRFVVVPVFRDERHRDGQAVRLHVQKGRVQSIETLGPERRDRNRGGPER